MKIQYKHNWIGNLAAFLSVIAVIPIVYKVTKTKDTSKLHIDWLLLEITAMTCWFFYGMYNSITPTVISSGIIVILLVYLLVRKILN